MKVQRNFVNITGTIKHIICSICQEIFDEPIRLFCGHTFCKACIINFKKYTENCPICRKDLVLKCNCSCCNELNAFGSRDLITQNIINDLDVYCNNERCPWTGHLSDLENHLKSCVFDEKKVPEFLKTFIEDRNKTKENNRKKILEENFCDEKPSFNTNSSLSQRLYSKNPKLLEMVNKSASNNKRDSLFDILANMEKNKSNFEEEIQQSNPLLNERQDKNFKANNSFSKNNKSHETDSFYVINDDNKENGVLLVDLNLCQGWKRVNKKQEINNFEGHNIKNHKIIVNLLQNMIEINNSNNLNKDSIKIYFDENSNGIHEIRNSDTDSKSKTSNFSQYISGILNKLPRERIQRNSKDNEKNKQIKETEEEKIARQISLKTYEQEEKIRRERSFPLTNSQGARIDTSLVKRIEGEITKRKKNN